MAEEKKAKTRKPGRNGKTSHHAGRSQRAGRTAGPWEPMPEELDMHRRWAEGETQSEIAKSVKMSQSAISTKLKRVERYLRERYVDDIRGLKVRQTVRLEKYVKELETAWEKSKGDAVTVTETEREGGSEVVPASEKSTKTTGQCGAVEYLNSAMSALDKIRKIWGADAPETNQVVHEIRVAGMPRDQARELMLQSELNKLRLRNSAILQTNPN